MPAKPYLTPAQRKERKLSYSRSPAQRAYQKAYRATEAWKEQNRRRQREWKARNRLKHNAIQRALAAKWRREKPEVIKARNRRHHERQRSTPELLARLAQWRENGKARRAARIENIRLLQRMRDQPAYMRSMMAEILAMVPRSLHPELREEVRNDLVRDILACELTVAQVPQVMKAYLAAARKTMHSDYQFSSLDDVIPGTDSLKRSDTIDAQTSIYTATRYKR